MLEAAELRPWINPALLDEHVLSDLRQRMAEHPARMVVIREVLSEDGAAALAAFLQGGADYRTEYGLYSRDEGVGAEEWDAAPGEDRFFRFDKLAGIDPGAALEPSTISYMQFRSWVSQPPFRGFMEALTGVPLGPSDDFGVHRFRRGDFLRDHDDDNRQRRIALVMYLTPGWRSEFGGALAMQHPDGTVETVEAEYNSMVTFDVAIGSTHHVHAVTEEAGDMARCTFGGWFPGAA